MLRVSWICYAHFETSYIILGFFYAVEAKVLLVPLEEGMEFATPKPLKPSSNISDIVSKFAKVCKLRSIGVFTSENQDHHHQHPNNPNNISAPFGEDGSDVTEDTERDGVKIHPQPMEVTRTSSMCGDAELSKLFDIVSALKLAYIQLQEAHVPYNPKKIVAADGHFMAELESLCQIKRVYKETQCVKPKSDSSHSAILRKKVELNEKLLEELKFQTEVKNSDIICLQQELRDLDLMNVTLAENARQISLQRKNARVLNITTFQDAYRAASKSIHDFAKPLISLMKASGWDLDLAAKAVEVEASYSKRSHKKYAFEAYIARRMFYGMSLKAYNVDGIMRYDDPMDALIENPDSDFADSAEKNSEAKIFAVKRGSKFSDAYMESVEEDGKGAAVLDEGQVEFMVMPGFRIGETIVRSRNHYELSSLLVENKSLHSSP
ncbi:Plant protein of unknown function D [Prunus dulcis]|uniref:Uncharacterized protein n=1 Tax=Prunus dulcis TaxID=3755 RepID=A0A4Y1RJP0_PRUDU|nr:Plant protein of unknown function D [Prunus dulcis]